MKIDVGAAWCHVHEQSLKEQLWLRDYLVYEIEGARFTPQYKAGWWDGKVKLYFKNDLFPIGMIRLVKKAAEAEGFQVTIQDKRVVPCLPDEEIDLSWMRAYQRTAVKHAEDYANGILWMATGCLTGDTKLTINRGGGARIYDLKTVVERMQGRSTTGRNGKQVGWDLRISTYTQSVDPDGFVRKNRIAAVWDAGVKEVFELATTSGRAIRATAEHRFLTSTGWRRLHELQVNDSIFVVNWPKSSAKSLKRKGQYDQTSGLWHHPYVQVSCTAKGKIARVPTHRLVAEANMNNKTLAEFAGLVFLNKLDGLQFLDPEQWHVHHTDLNTKNNNLDNLKIMSKHEHLAHHGVDSHWQHVAGQTVREQVASIAPCGTEHVYDLTMEAPMHNYVANEFVVHNSGKTEVAIGLMNRLPTRWLFIAGQKDLVHQGAERFEKRTGERPGIIGDGTWNTNERVTFATFQTLGLSLDKKSAKYRETEAFLAQQGGLIVDEAHCLGATGFWKVSMACKNAYYRIGLSATPLARGDKRSIYTVGALGPVIYRVRPTTLSDAGILALPKINMFPLRQDHPGRRYADVYEALIVNSDERNKLGCAMVQCATRPGLVFVNRTAHGRVITKALQRMGLNAEFVHGDIKTLQRQGLVDRLNRGDVDFGVSTDVFKTGIDIPDLRSIINLAGGKSKISAVQMMGRGSRRPSGKDSFEMWDIFDRGNKWLSKHARDRANAYEAEGYKVTIWKEGTWPTPDSVQQTA